MDEAAFIEFIKQRLNDIFHAYQQGLDVSPASLYRTEGLLEAAVQLGFLSQSGAKNLIGVSYRKFFNDDMPDNPNDAIYIPAQMKRAPVYPSKK